MDGQMGWSFNKDSIETMEDERTAEDLQNRKVPDKQQSNNSNGQNRTIVQDVGTSEYFKSKVSSVQVDGRRV